MCFRRVMFDWPVLACRLARPEAWLLQGPPGCALGFQEPGNSSGPEYISPSRVSHPAQGPWTSENYCIWLDAFLLMGQWARYALSRNHPRAGLHGPSSPFLRERCPLLQLAPRL